MPRQRELFDGGLVNARDPASLKPGELRRCDDVLYHPNDTALHRTPNRTTASVSGLGAAVTGLAFCAFDYVRPKVVITRSSATLTAVTTPVPACSAGSGSTTLTTTNTFVGIKTGAGVTGTNIPANTTVATWDSPTQVTLSAATTGVISAATVTFASEGFEGVTAGAVVAGPGIPDGTTVLSKASRVSLTMSANATETRQDFVTIGADDLLLAQASTTYSTAPVTGTGTSLTFTALETVTPGDALETVHYGNRHYILNGKHENRVLTADGRTRKHGLLPVRSAASLAIASGTWALISGVGYYAYWTTEYDKPNDIESTWSGGEDAEGRAIQPPWAHITTTSQKVTITRPERLNASATHWRLYRSVKMDAQTDAAANKEAIFPNGYLVGTYELRDDNSQISVDDGGATANVSGLATGVGTVGTSSTGLTWTSTTNIFTNNTAFANLTWASGGTTANRFIVLESTNHSVSAVSAPISGIAITVRGKRTGNGGLTAVPAKVTDPLYSLGNPDVGGFPIAPTNPANLTGTYGAKVVPLTTSNADQVVGTQNDKWGRDWDVSDFVNGKFTIRLYGTVTRSGDTVDVDSVTVTVYYGETQGGGAGTLSNTNKNNTEAFKSVTVTPFDFSISVGRDGPPPRATTGDILQDCLLLNDVNAGNVARYSSPTRPDSFPAAYLLKFDTQATLTKIRTLGAIGIVAFDSEMYRVNNLPLQTDASFSPGREVEAIEGSFGVPARKCGERFVLPGGLYTFFYVNRYGPFMTDGYRNRPASGDLDWQALVDITNITKTYVVNNPELHILEVYYVPVDAPQTTYPSKVLFFHYHASHLKNGALGPELKVTGPYSLMVGAAVRAALVGGLSRVYTGQADGSFHVQYENLASASGTPIIRTRRIEANGPTGEWRADEAYLAWTQRSFSIGSPGNVTVDSYTFTTGFALRQNTQQTIAVPAFAGGGITFPKQNWREKVFVPEGLNEGLEYEFTATIPGSERLSFDNMVFAGENWGDEDSA